MWILEELIYIDKKKSRNEIMMEKSTLEENNGSVLVKERKKTQTTK